MYSNNILKVHESTTNVHTKKSGNLSYSPPSSGFCLGASGKQSSVLGDHSNKKGWNKDVYVRIFVHIYSILTAGQAVEVYFILRN